MRCIVLLFGLLGFSSILQAEEKIPYAGTWSGTIGTHKVQVCFNDYGGQYYYLSQKKGIELSQDSLKPSMNELREYVGNYYGNSTGQWKFNTITANQLQGSWTNAKNQQHLDINLKRLSHAGKNGCDNVFYEPIIQAIKYSYGTGKFLGKNYKTITSATGEAFEFPKNLKNAKRINEFIQFWLKSQAVQSYECNAGGGSGWLKTLEPIFLTTNWLVMKDALPDTYCGGAHSDWALEYLVFNLNSGKKVNVWNWLKGGKERTENGAANENEATRLHALLNKNKPRKDCETFMYLREPYPTATGLVFPTGYAHVDRACEDEIFISYKALKPFLTAKGKVAVKSILSEIKTH